MIFLINPVIYCAETANLLFIQLLTFKDFFAFLVHHFNLEIFGFCTVGSFLPFSNITPLLQPILDQRSSGGKWSLRDSPQTAFAKNSQEALQ